MKALHVISFILVIIGGLNWGLVGLGGFMGGNWNVVNMVVGSMPMIEWLVYVLVGVGAVVLAATHKSDCRACAVGAAPAAMGSGAPMGSRM